jgi:hypothetical protein
LRKEGDVPTTAPRARSIPGRSIACTVLLFTLAVAGPAAADPILYSGNGHYFDVIDGAMDWNTANQAAQAQTFKGAQGQLVTITTSQENQFLTQAFGAAKLELHWTGGMLFYPMIFLPGPGGGPPPTAPPPTGSWASGTPFAYTNWAAGGPVYLPATLGRIVFGREGTGDGQDWIDFPFSATAQGYVVEYTVVDNPPPVNPGPVADSPEPATLTMMGCGALGLGGCAWLRRWRVRKTAAMR